MQELDTLLIPGYDLGIGLAGAKPNHAPAAALIVFLVSPDH